jgi:hypothetical protein
VAWSPPLSPPLGCRSLRRVVVIDPQGVRRAASGSALPGATLRPRDRFGIKPTAAQSYAKQTGPPASVAAQFDALEAEPDRSFERWMTRSPPMMTSVRGPPRRLRETHVCVAIPNHDYRLWRSTSHEPRVVGMFSDDHAKPLSESAEAERLGLAPSSGTTPAHYLKLSARHHQRIPRERPLGDAPNQRTKREI